jgi:hypothetical protein
VIDVEDQVKELLREMAQEVPAYRDVPPDLKVRARQRIAATIAGGALLIAIAVLLTGAGLRALDLGTAPVPAISVTPSSPTPVSTTTAMKVSFSQEGCSYNGPARVPAGRVTIRVRNRSKDGLYFALLSIAGGHTYADLQRWTTGPDRNRPPAWVATIDDADIAPSYGRHNTSLDLSAGLYGIVCGTPKARDAGLIPLWTPASFTVTG